MVLPSEDDRDAIDRAFAELVAGYHLTAESPDSDTAEPPTEPVSPPSLPDASGAANWATDHPLFGLTETPTDAQTSFHEPLQDHYVPEPLPPLRRAWGDPACRHCLAGSASGTRSSSSWQRPSACASPLGLAGSQSEASWVDLAS